MKLLEIITLSEHKEQMIKRYVKTGIFDEEDVNIVLSITNGGPYTKLIADAYYYFADMYNPAMVKRKKLSHHEIDLLNEFYNLLQEYNSNVFPLKDIYAVTKNAHPLESFSNLKTRKVIINKLKELPSIFLRNLKNNIRKERDYYEFDSLLHTINFILNFFKIIRQVPKKRQEKIFKKIFSNEFDTFEKVLDRLQKMSMPYLHDDSNIDELLDKINDLEDEAELIYNKNNIIAIAIHSFYAMSIIGCSSTWCFVTSNHYWDEYTKQGDPIIIFNLNKTSKKRMVVVLGDGSVYNMYNDYIENGNEYLQKIGIADLIYKYNYVHENKNRLSLTKIFNLIENARK